MIKLPAILFLSTLNGHVRNGDQLWIVYQSKSKCCFQSWFVKARKCSSCIRRLKLGSCHSSTMKMPQIHWFLSTNRSFYSQCVLSVLAFEQKRSKGDLVTKNLLVFNNVNAWLSSSSMRITQFAHEMQHLQPHLFIYLSRAQAHSCKMAY